MEAKTPKAFPDECWEMIFYKLDHGSDWDSVSLVCKDFLSITNRLKRTLVVFSPSIEVLSRLLKRFLHLQKVQLASFLGDLSKAVLQIARSQLNLEELDLSCNEDLATVCLEDLGSSLTGLKVLCCSRSSLTDADLVRIANCFPQLEKLDISDSCFPRLVDGRTIAVTDEGVEYLSSKLRKLRMVNLSGNQCISDKSLISLSSNCAFLEQIVLGYCRNVTEYGVSHLLHNYPYLTSLLLGAHFEIGSFGLNGCSNFPKNLQSLRFARVVISDELLYSIALARIPLNEITLSFCQGYTFTGISSLLRSYQSLNTLDLLGADFLTNEHIHYLSPFLRNLSSLQLYNCPKLSDSAFLMLSERCTRLSNLEMGDTGLGQGKWNNNNSPVKNFTMKSLNLSSNCYLSSYSLRKLLDICPNVENLTLSNCFRLDEELDVADILDSNSTIKTLEIDGCSRLKFSGPAVNVSKLERLTAEHSGINDESLAMFGKICPNLLHLNMVDCGNITEAGVKEIVKSCTKLRYLSLSDCCNVNVDVVGWIISNSSSLRQLVSPSHLYPQQEDQNYFLDHGCLVTPGRDCV